MSVEEAAAALGLSIRGIRYRIEQGQMKAERIGRRVYAIPRDEVERWQELGKQKPGPAKGTTYRPRAGGGGAVPTDDA